MVWTIHGYIYTETYFMGTETYHASLEMDTLPSVTPPPLSTQRKKQRGEEEEEGGGGGRGRGGEEGGEKDTWDTHN